MYNLSFKIISEIGVNLGGTKLQGKFNLTILWLNSVFKALASPST